MSCKSSNSPESPCPNGLCQLQPIHPQFSRGRIVATHRALIHLEHHGIATDPNLMRHVGGDQGMVAPEDARANCLTVQHGTRILSSYYIPRKRVWLVTELDRSLTTLLLLEEY
jgi:hypothetical protein